MRSHVILVVVTLTVLTCRLYIVESAYSDDGDGDSCFCQVLARFLSLLEWNK